MALMLRRKTGRQNYLRMAPCAFAPRGGALVSNGTRLRLSAPMPLLRGATRTFTEQLPSAITPLGATPLTLHYGLLCSTRTPAGTREPFQNPLRPSPPEGAALLLLLARGGARKAGLQKAV